MTRPNMPTFDMPPHDTASRIIRHLAMIDARLDRIERRAQLNHEETMGTLKDLTDADAALLTDVTNLAAAIDGAVTDIQQLLAKIGSGATGTTLSAEDQAALDTAIQKTKDFSTTLQSQAKLLNDTVKPPA